MLHSDFWHGTEEKSPQKSQQTSPRKSLFFDFFAEFYDTENKKFQNRISPRKQENFFGIVYLRSKNRFKLGFN